MASEFNYLVGAMGNTNAKFQNLKNFVTSFNDVFGDSVENPKPYDMSSKNFGTYGLDPTDTVYINIQKIRNNISTVVNEYKQSLDNISNLIYTQKKEVETEPTINYTTQAENKNYKLLVKVINNIQKDYNNNKFVVTQKETLKNRVNEYLSLYKNYNDNELNTIRNNISNLLLFTNYDMNGLCKDLLRELEVFNNRISELVYNNKEQNTNATNKNVNVNSEIEQSYYDNISYDLFINKIKLMETDGKNIINDLYRESYSYIIRTNLNELEVILKSNVNVSDYNSFSSQFDELVDLAYDNDYFRAIKEQITNITNGKYEHKKIVDDNIYTNTFKTKDKGQLIATVVQTSSPNVIEDGLSFNIDFIDQYVTTDLRGNYLKAISGNNTYYEIIDWDDVSKLLSISVNNRNISFNHSNEYAIYDDYNLDTNSNIISNISDKLEYYNKSVQESLDGVVEKLNEFIIEIVKYYFKAMFLERTFLLDILNNKIENFYMGDFKVGEIVRMIQSSFTIVRPPIIKGDYGDEQGLGGKKFSEDYDPLDKGEYSLFGATAENGKYPVGEAYAVLYAIETIVDWYITIFKTILTVANIDLGNVDFDMINRYVTGYKNPLSISILSPIIKNMRNLINDGINNIVEWVREQVTSVEGEFNLETDIKIIENAICKRTKEILVTDTLNLDATLRDTLGNNLFSPDVSSKARSLLETSVDDCRDFLLDEVNRKIGEGTYVTNLLNDNIGKIRAIVTGMVIGAIAVRLLMILIYNSISLIDNLIIYFINLVIANIESNLIQDSNDELLQSYKSFKRDINNKNKNVSNIKADDLTNLVTAYNFADENTKALINTSFNEIEGIRDFIQLDKYANIVEASKISFESRMKEMAFKVYKTDEFILFEDDDVVGQSASIRNEIEERLLFISTLILTSHESYKVNNNKDKFVANLSSLEIKLSELNVYLNTNYNLITFTDRVAITLAEDVLSTTIKTNITEADLKNGYLKVKKDGNYTTNIVDYTLIKVQQILEEEADFDSVVFYNMKDIKKEVVQDILTDDLGEISINVEGYDTYKINSDYDKLVDLDDITYFDTDKYNSSKKYIITRTNNEMNILPIENYEYIKVIYRIGDLVLCDFTNVISKDRRENVTKNTTTESDYNDACDVLEDESLMNSLATDGTYDNDYDFFDENTYRLSYVLPDFEAMFKFDWIAEFVEDVENVLRSTATNFDKPEAFYKQWVKKNIQYYCGSNDLDYDIETGKIKRCKTVSDYNFSNFNEVPQNDICNVLKNSSIEEMKEELKEAGLFPDLDSVTKNIETLGNLDNVDKDEDDNQKSLAKVNMKKFLNDSGEVNNTLLIKMGLVLLDEQTKQSELPSGVTRDEDGSLLIDVYPISGSQSKIKMNPLDYGAVCQIRDDVSNMNLLDVEGFIEKEIDSKLNILPKHLRDKVKRKMLAKADTTSDTDFCI